MSNYRFVRARPAKLTTRLPFQLAKGIEVPLQSSSSAVRGAAGPAGVRRRHGTRGLLPVERARGMRLVVRRNQGNFLFRFRCSAASINAFHLRRQMIKGEFLVVEYSGWEKSYTEIVSVERVRPKNSNPPITTATFVKYEIEVPEELRA